MDRLDHLAWACLDGSATAVELAELDRLVLASPAAADRLAAHLRLHHRLGGHAGLAGGAGTPRPRSRRMRRRVTRGTGAALGLATLIAAGVLIAILAQSTGTGAPVGWVVRDADGERALAEGTTLVPTAAVVLVRRGEATSVAVAAGARLRLRDRLLHLERGGIDCTVQPGAGLRVATPHATVQVLGTRFTVEVEAATRCAVARGRVAFRPHAGGEHILGPGEQASTAPPEAAVAAPAAPSPAADPPRVLAFVLIDAATGDPIPGHDPLVDGAVIDLDRVGTRQLNVVVRERGADRVRITWDGGTLADEQHPPWTLAGNDRDGRFHGWRPGAGRHVLAATPAAGGVDGPESRITVEVRGR